MKIICVGRNYSEHIHEMNNVASEEPVIFFKPETALLKNNAPFYYPSFSKDVHYEAELVIRINREGKNIEERFSHKYYDELGVGIDFTARDLQKKAQEKGLPWALAKGFNGSAPISGFVPKSKFEDIYALNFSLKQNGELKQHGNSSMMIHSIDKIVSYISKFITLKNGDYIYTGTPSGVGPVKIGDLLEVFLEKEKMLECAVK
ncbi:MAG TPA: fumarylacetoacetate hydrolase family protein [Cytophagaceae bacterium]|jgi:acylpyruvate hydrolase|nr:fumarylacetoacetate hydrolase family protein [Cytophagaceae bacterium]